MKMLVYTVKFQLIVQLSECAGLTQPHFIVSQKSYKQHLKAVIMTRTRAEEPMIQLKGCDTYEYHRIISTRREYHMAVRIGMN